MRRFLSLVNRDRLKKVLRYMLDEDEFLSPYGVRALSRYHKDHPYVFSSMGSDYRVDYEPAESSTGLFGGNSNWRGPVWFPVNYLLIESLQKFHYFLGDSLQVEYPTGSGQLTLWPKWRPNFTPPHAYLSARSGWTAAGLTAGPKSFSRIRIGVISCCSTNISMATTGPASARAIRPAGPDWWPS